MLAYLLIIVIAFMAVAFTLIQLVGEYLFSQRITEDADTAHTLSVAVADDLYERDSDALFDTAQRFSAGLDQRVLVLDEYGVVQADALSLLNGTRFAMAEVQKVLNGDSDAYGYYATGEEDVGSRWMSLLTQREATGVFASAITRDGRTIGALVYISHAGQIYDSLENMQLRITLWIVLVTIAVLVISLFVLRKITGPIAELNDGIQKMTKGDFSARVNLPGKNEFAQLGSAFNNMSERLEKLDQARNQFVSNASHELKTPLATMKIMLQSVQMGGDDMPLELRNEFLNDVDKEIDRLTRIVGDLLTLVNIDSGGMQLNREVFSLRDLVQDQVKRLLPLARERGIEMECTVPKESSDVDGDLSKLSQVVYNVIDNAIKYTPRGGNVRVEMNRSGKKAVVKIADTGIGIPENDLAHIFDRFYRVDKARSRETGGTGLGLSIVKQIVNLHDGDITVTSIENQGSTFTITLPLANK